MADKKRTLWDRLTGANVFIANEDKYHNPLKVRIGNSIHLDLLGYRDVFYTVKQFAVFDRNTGVPLTDYRLEATVSAKPVPDDKKLLFLRTVPRSGDSGASKIDFRIVMLAPYYECAWDDESIAGIMEGVNDPAGEFVIDAGTPGEKKYWRLQDLKTAENVAVTTIKDADGDAGQMQLEMWGFSRTTEDEAKQEVNEYLYVQKDSQSGWLQILTGQEIPPERINV